MNQLSRMRTVLSSLVAIGILGAIAAQDPSPTQPIRNQVEEKEEKESKTPPKLKVIDVDDDPPVPKVAPPKEPPRRPRIAPGGDDVAAVNLNTEADRATHPQVRAMFIKLAVPHDSLVAGDNTFNIEPIAEPWLDLVARGGDVAIVRLNARGQPAKEVTVQVSQIKVIRSYEELALADVTSFLSRGLAKPESPLVTAIPRMEQLIIAEKILSHTKTFHLSSIEQRRRAGNWDNIRKQIIQKLLDVQREQLKLYLASRQWDAAGELALRMTVEHPDDLGVLQDVFKVELVRIEANLKDAPEGIYVQLRDSLNQYERQFPNSKEEIVEIVRRRLRSKAEEYVRQAETLSQQGQNAKALAKLRAAEVLDSETPELNRVRSTLKVRYPILYVGVRELPERMTPLTARSDADYRAMELLYESLVEVLPDLQLGRRYRPELALGLPLPSPLSRDFKLVANARWSMDSLQEVVDARDINGTIQMLQAFRDRPAAEGIDLLETGRIDDHPFRLRVRLRQGYLDPLSLMTFKVLPAQYLQRKGLKGDDLNFSAKPFGSGPYRYDGLEKEENGRVCAVFRANPFYGQRPGKLGLPNIREIRMYDATKLASPGVDFEAGAMHLLLDVPVEDLSKLKPLSTDGGSGLVRIHTLRTNRRVHFLAVNHRQPNLQSADLRRGLAHAIQREDILTGIFREGNLASKFHRALPGPFPPATWAVPDRVPDLFKEQLAATLLGNRVAQQGPIKITLKYPNDDIAVGLAMAKVREQIEKLSQPPGQEQKISIELIGLSPSDLRRQVEVEHNFELAYMSHDYSNDLFSLAGLFDATAAGPYGRNYMSYLVPGTGTDEADRRLEQLLRETYFHRDFRGDLREKTHELHRLFNDRMPFVPLWQLDRHLVTHQKLQIEFEKTKGPDVPTLLDPVRIFTQVAEWKLNE